MAIALVAGIVGYKIREHQITGDQDSRPIIGI